MGNKDNGAATLDTNLVMVGEGLATVEQTAKFLAVSQAQIYKLMESGELASAKLGKSRRLPWAALKDYAASSLVG